MNYNHTKKQFDLLDDLEECINKIEAYADVLEGKKAPNEYIGKQLKEINKILKECYQGFDDEMK